MILLTKIVCYLQVVKKKPAFQVKQKDGESKVTSVAAYKKSAYDKSKR